MTETSLELPCGYESEGTVIRPVTIKRMKGRVQRDIAALSAKKKSDPAEILEAVLRPSWVSLGGNKVNKVTLLGALLADRDFLLFEMVKLLRGSKVSMEEECPARGCDETFEIFDIDLDELPVTRLGDDSDWWGPQGLVKAEDVKGMSDGERALLECRVFVLENEELGTHGVFRYPRGKEQRQVSSLAEKPIEVIWKLMSLTCLSWKCPDLDIPATPKGGLKMTFWDDVDYLVLEWLEEAFGEAQPGVDSSLDATCTSCGHEFKTQVRALDFLFRKSQKER
jgi:hypothetical protein